MLAARRRFMAITTLPLPPSHPGPVFFNPPGLYDPRPNGYSHVAVTDTPARLVLASGQGGENERGELAHDFPSQLRQALDNVETALRGVHAGLGDIVRLQLLIVDHDETKLAHYTREIKRRWGEQRLAPACTLIPVPRLALDGMLVEIEATAVLPLPR